VNEPNKPRAGEREAESKNGPRKSEDVGGGAGTEPLATGANGDARREIAAAAPKLSKKALAYLAKSTTESGGEGDSGRQSEIAKLEADVRTWQIIAIVFFVSLSLSGASLETCFATLLLALIAAVLYRRNL
jgi:hypothetical protein